MNKSFKYIPLHKPFAGEDEIESVSQAIRDGWLAPGGPYTERFEKQLTRYTGARYAIALQSGTAALHLALKAVGIKPGDFVLLPTHTFVATANPVLYEKAVPVLVDTDKDGINLSMDYLAQAVEHIRSEYRVTPRTLIAVHLYGFSTPVSEITAFTKHFGIILVEDAAESLGTFVNGQHTGTFGTLGILSFNGNKIISTSGGGAVLTNDAEKAAYIRFLSGQAKEDKPYYYHKEIGYNYRISNILAALGEAQVNKIDDFLQRKRKIHAFYRSVTRDLPVNIYTPVKGQAYNYWLNVLHFTDPASPTRFIDFMHRNGIEVRHTWYPLHKMPLFEKYLYFGHDESLEFFKHSVLLPSGAGLTENELDYIATRIRKFFKS